jgi:hypothetical protein
MRQTNGVASVLASRQISVQRQSPTFFMYACMAPIM